MHIKPYEQGSKLYVLFVVTAMNQTLFRLNNYQRYVDIKHVVEIQRVHQNREQFIQNAPGELN